MKINIHLSGIVHDLAKTQILSLDIKNTDNLMDEIKKTIQGLENYYVAVSVNGELKSDYSSIRENDEILVFSPFSGG